MVKKFQNTSAWLRETSLSIRFKMLDKISWINGKKVWISDRHNSNLEMTNRPITTPRQNGGHHRPSRCLQRALLCMRLKIPEIDLVLWLEISLRKTKKIWQISQSAKKDSRHQISLSHFKGKPWRAWLHPLVDTYKPLTKTRERSMLQGKRRRDLLLLISEIIKQPMFLRPDQWASTK